MIQNILDSVRGYKIIKILNKENFFLDKLKENTKSFMKFRMKVAFIKILPRYLFEILFVSLVCASVVFVFLFRFPINEFLITMVLFSVASIRLIPCANSILTNFYELRFKRNSINILYDNLKEIENYEKEQNNIKNSFLPLTFNKLEFKNVNFSYEQHKIFDDINFKIHKGDRVAILGELGIGKTTLINMIMGFLEPDKGNIFINDKILFENQKKFNKLITYIPQDSFIFADTVKNNITFENNIKKINFNKLKKSIKESKLELGSNYTYEKIIKKNITDTGDNISGGQKQRISLARIFYFQSEIIIMDEPTSALDLNTEIYIASSLKKIDKYTTVFIVVHNSRIVDDCNVKLFIKNKKVYIERK